MFRMTSAMLAACVASGCVATDAVYPATWASRVKLDSRDCPNLDGEYMNQGDVSLENDANLNPYGSGYAVEASSISLADMLAGQAEGQEGLNFSRVDAATDSHRSVRLHADGGTLHILANRSDGSSRSFELPIGDRCEGSMIDAGGNWDGTTIVLASTVDHSGMKLGRAEDGALLIHTNQASGYFFMYMPVFATKDERWVRFPQFDPESVSSEVADLQATVQPETLP